MNLKALTEQRAEKQTEMETLLNTVKAEERAFTEDEITENYTNGYDAESYDEDYRKGFSIKKG